MTTKQGENGKQMADFYQGRRILVTGGASFIGSFLVELLVDSGAIVCVADDLSSGKRAFLAGVEKRITFRQGDLRDSGFAETVCRDMEIVFHLAAAHGGRGYIETHPVECLNNMVLDHTVFTCAARAECSKIVFASSACVYPTHLQNDTEKRLLLRESDANFEEPGRAFADGEYGWAKLMGELQLRAVHKQYGLSGVCCRIFTVYGERENESHAVIALVVKALAKLSPYPIWGDGRQTRNFTYVADTVTGLALSGMCAEGFHTINIGTDSHHTILELIEEIFRSLKWRPGEIERELDKPVGVKTRASDNTLCRSLLNWAPQYSLRDGVSRTVRWFSEHYRNKSAANLESLLMERTSKE